MLDLMLPQPQASRAQIAWAEAEKICDEDVQQNQAIGQHGLALMQQTKPKHPQIYHVLTHCNAGWLATVDVGTALAPIYAAHEAGIKLHVWVDETRPRNQGASLTAWELGQHGIDHTVISDNAGGHLMQQGLVDMVLVGADRVSSAGDVCNKIGTYLKALAAFDNGVPFYAAVPSPTIDWSIKDALAEIEIEQRHGDEVAYMQGLAPNGEMQNVRLIPAGSDTANPAFDVTPARLVTGIITERGVFSPADLVGMRLSKACD
jgi:methylthioribose-1-phosphate isomerase